MSSPAATPVSSAVKPAASSSNVHAGKPSPQVGHKFAKVIDITDHPVAASASREIRARALVQVQHMPAKLRRARGTYAYAEGLHTVMHYPQLFLVTLKGEPAIRNDFSTAPSMTTGHAGPAAAVNSTLQYVMDPQVNKRSHCNHKGCIYNQGDLVTRRNRFRLATAELDAKLQERSSAQHKINERCCHQSKQLLLKSFWTLVQVDIYTITFGTLPTSGCAYHKLCQASWEAA